jgi:hypothetical protein
MSAVFLVFAVGTGVVVIAVAVAVVLVVLIIALSMRGRQKRAAQRRVEARRGVDKGHGRPLQAERDRDPAQGGGDSLGGDR